MNTISPIPVRSGSRGIPRKNVRLLINTIEHVQKGPDVIQSFVSTNAIDIIASTSFRWNATLPT